MSVVWSQTDSGIVATSNEVGCYVLLLIVVPLHYDYTTLGVLAANGSSVTGSCSSVTHLLNSKSRCSSPDSSVLFDGIIPTLTALDGDSWARPLMILQQPIAGPVNFGRYSIDFTFDSEGPDVRRAEITVFNCPQWGAGLTYLEIITLRPTDDNFALAREQAFTTVIACDSLVTICIPIDTSSALMRLEIQPRGEDNAVFAEVSFFDSASPCTPFTTIPGNWTPQPIQGKIATMVCSSHRILQ